MEPQNGSLEGAVIREPTDHSPLSIFPHIFCVFGANFRIVYSATGRQLRNAWAMTDPPEVTPASVSQSNQTDAATEALHRHTQSAKDFLRYQPIYAEGAEAKKTLSLKEAEIRKKNEQIEKLESAIAVWIHGGHKEVTRIKSEKDEIVKEKTNLDIKLQQALKEKGKAEEQAERTKCLLDEQDVESAKLKNEVLMLKDREEALKTNLRKETAAKEDVNDQLSTTRIELEKYAAYRANLINLDLSKFSKGVAKIWERTHTLVKKYFSLDILTESSEEHENWIQQAFGFLHPPSGSILIPPTNSSAAKVARMAVMLNVFALVFVKCIFTVTPPLLAQAGLDNILSEIVDKDDMKEALCRAILLSASSSYPSQDRELQQHFVKWILETFGTLLSSKSRTEFKSDVKDLMTEATNCWIKSRWSRRKLIATLNYESYPGSWRDFPGPSQKHQQNTKNAEASDPEDQEEVTLVAFPAIIAMSSGTWETILPGFLIRYSHLYEAEVEWRSEQKKRRFSRSGVPNGISGLPSLRGAGGAMV